jgi:hypothetical protein
MTEEKTNPKNESIKEFLESFKLASERKRHGLLTFLEERAEELIALDSSVMSGFDPDICDWAPGFILMKIS